MVDSAWSKTLQERGSRGPELRIPALALTSAIINMQGEKLNSGSILKFEKRTVMHLNILVFPPTPSSYAVLQHESKTGYRSVLTLSVY